MTYHDPLDIRLTAVQAMYPRRFDIYDYWGGASYNAITITDCALIAGIQLVDQRASGNDWKASIFFQDTSGSWEADSRIELASQGIGGARNFFPAFPFWCNNNTIKIVVDDIDSAGSEFAGAVDKCFINIVHLYSGTGLPTL